MDVKSWATCLDLKTWRQPPPVFDGGGGDAIWSNTHGTSEENDHMDIVSSSFDCIKLVPGINIYYLINETFGQNIMAIMMQGRHKKIFILIIIYVCKSVVFSCFKS